MYVKTIHDRYRKVNDDEVAMMRLRELRTQFDADKLICRDVAGESSLSCSAVGHAALYPETCSLWVYKRLAAHFKWEGYVSGRKLSPSAKQGVIPFVEFTTPPEERSEYDLRNMTDTPTLDSLKMIAETLHKTFPEVVERALRLYIRDCQRVLDYAGGKAKCAI